MGIEHVYDSRSTDFADQIRKDTDGLRRRRRAELAAGCGPVRRAGAAVLRWAFRRDRQTRHLRRHPAWAVPVPAQSDVLRSRSRLDERHPPGRGPRTATNRVPDDGGRHPADAAEHALPDRGCRGRGPSGRGRRAHRQGGPRPPADRAHSSRWSRPPRRRSSGPTAPTSSPAAWAVSASSSRGRWRRRAVLGSCSTRDRLPAPRHSRRSSASGPTAPTSWSSVATSPTPRPRSGWWRWQARPGSRCAVSCTPPRWSRTRR